MKKQFALFASLFLIVPLLFFGCGSGDTGPAGPAGPAGPPGPGGGPGPGLQAAETCVVCHGTGQFVDVRAMHRLNANGTLIQGGTLTTAITGVTFTPTGDNVITRVTFNFQAFNQAGLNITSNIDLRTFSGTQLSYTRFSIAQLVPGQNGSPHEWNDFVNNQRVAGRLVLNDPALGAINSYTYTFSDNSVTISSGYQDNLTTRAAIQISGLTAALFTADPLLSAPVANPTFDLVPNGTTIGSTPSSVTRDVVTTAACNGCHDPLALHGGGRRETKYCVICHNATLPPDGQLVRLVHKIHSADNNIVIGTRIFGPGSPPDFSEVTYPQDRRNCTTCHKGPDGNNWRTRPSREACGTCHKTVNFATGLNHVGGPQADDSLCVLCHTPALITIRHSTENSTPNNPADPPGLVTFRYNISNVTVDNTNKAVVTFSIESATAGADGQLGPFTFLNLGASGDNATRPAGFTGSPSFLVAYSLSQDGITTPADYNNLGRNAGQPASVSLIPTTGPGLRLTGTPASYTVTLPSSAAFPAGATMRAVALQGYFTQTNVDISVPLDGIPDNVGRHTPAVMRGVTGDAVRRTVVKSGYDNVAGVLTPVGCLECHEIFEGHGGNRVNNVQVCVMCHNPSLTSSGRTINPAGPDPINPTIVASFGSNPLLYPEVPNNFKSLIHGLHSTIRPNNPFVDIRNRTASGFAGVDLRTSEITYPGNPRHCTKCHIGTTATNGTFRVENIPANSLWTTDKITTGNPAETRDDILAARAAMPNPTDLVSSPIASTCYACHASDVVADHTRLNGADISAQRSSAIAAAVPAAAPLVEPAP